MLLLRELDRQARLQGGAVYMLNGNHESLNVCGDFRRAPGHGASLASRGCRVPASRWLKRCYILATTNINHPACDP